ncbi:MarR family transcriptional regulator [Salipaludibacillus neizhouensis]|uniref:MarR family transcriptional regulator n=1 Tax=Salipaludibacillus neizhouensis TaxID=885475 RepID=A0A3A9KAG6_9BACI|nr:MarR family transcriptional regulator [Salipaludibacillus neizhouensis]RKL66563.1 MarR family transcriptional regulator [Salipaludibacillus neizhouensis]
MLEKYLTECLYFTASRLDRIITKMAEDEFSKTGLSPTAAYLLMVVYEDEGLSQKKIGETLYLKPSTVTRTIDNLVRKELINKEINGRTTLIYSTNKGKELSTLIHECWFSLRDHYSSIIGKEDADEITNKISKINDQLDIVD